MTSGPGATQNKKAAQPHARRESLDEADIEPSHPLAGKLQEMFSLLDQAMQPVPKNSRRAQAGCKLKVMMQ